MTRPGQWKAATFIKRMDVILRVYVLVAVAATLHKFALGTFTPRVKRTKNFVLLVIAFVFVSLSSTGLFPPVLRKIIVKPYVLKGVPCILIWMLIQYELLFATTETDDDFRSAAAAPVSGI